jgi:hypothetical protein
MSNNLPNIPPTITLPTPAAELDRAGRITYYHTLSREAGRVSIMAAVAAGVELHRAKAEMPHGNFQLWIRRHCSFSYRTARNYMSLAESVAAEQLAGLVAAAEPPAIEVLEEMAQPIEARTLTQLYFDLGICKQTKVGGKREGAGRPAKEPDADAALNEALMLANKLVGDLSVWVLGDDGFGALPDDVLQQCVTMLSDITKRGRDILSGRKLAAKAPANAPAKRKDSDK